MASNRSILLKIYLTPEENQDLQIRADAAKLSRSHYGRAVLFSFPERSSPSGCADASEQRSVQEREDALLLQLGQQYSLLSILQSEITAWLKVRGADSERTLDSPLTQLQAIQAQLTEIQQVMQALSDCLNRQQTS